MSAEPVDLHVDLGALQSLRDEVDAIRGQLAASTGRYGGHDGSVYGDGDVAGAVASFVDHWRYGRARLDRELEGCVTELDAALRQYRDADEGVARAAVPGRPAPQGAPA